MFRRFRGFRGFRLIGTQPIVAPSREGHAPSWPQWEGHAPSWPTALAGGTRTPLAGGYPARPRSRGTRDPTKCAVGTRGRDALLRVRGHAGAWLSHTPRVVASYPTGYPALRTGMQVRISCHGTFQLIGKRFDTINPKNGS